MRWLFLLVALSACKGEWVTEVERKPYTVKQHVECSKPGICYKCRYDYDEGRRKCGYQMSLSCPGKKWVLVEVTPYEGYYKNYPDEYLKKTKERTLHDLSECER